MPAPEIPKNETSTPLPASADQHSTESDARAETLVTGIPEDRGTLVGIGGGVKILNARFNAGDLVGKYEIRSLLGEGGMGAVYLAYDPLIEREVALKVLAQDVGSSPTALQRFLGEARAIGRLSSPHVVSIYDIDQWQGQYYIVMELLTGGSVADYADRRGVLPWKDAFQIVAQAARGLAAAHAAGMIHRDIKPENLMLTGDGQVKVVDFGLSKLVDVADDTHTAVTKAGQILGTPQYMSPEQFEAEDIDARTDIYSLGATLFRLLTAKFPYHDCRTLLQVMTAHVSKPPPVPTEHVAALPEECNRIISRAMAKRPIDRYQTAAEMAADLQTAVDRQCEEDDSPELTSAADRMLSRAAIIEPSKLQGAVLKDALTRAGVPHVQIFSTAESSIAAIQRELPDLLITAMQLPDGRGLDLLKQLGRQSTLKETCVVLNSSDSTLEDLATAGPAASLVLASKRVRPEELLRFIHAVGPCVTPTELAATGVDPTTVRVRILLDRGQVPEALARLLRESNVLDVEVSSQPIGAASASEPCQLVLAICSDSRSSDVRAQYTSLISQSSKFSSTIAAVQVTDESLWLRGAGRQGLAAICRRPFDMARLVGLLQTCRL